jgi:hypothetical protein
LVPAVVRMTDFDRPGDLDPAPRGVVDWLNASNDQGVSMLQLRLAELLEESDPTLYLELLEDALSFIAEGPDDHGVFTAELICKTTGEAVRA